jgi:hypothetical protein
MKDKRLIHHHEEAQIYRRYYKPSFNMIRFLKSILAVIITGSSPAAGTYQRRK